MSTPKSGWIVRDGDGELHWYDREPEWIAPGECIQIGADDPDMPYTDNPGSTHWEGCYRTRGHHNCAVRQVDRLQAELERMREASHALAMASLQSQRYVDEPEYRRAVDDVLELTKARAALGEGEG